jgi:hypothetical protein
MQIKMPSTYINPFDFRKLLLDYFIGDGLLFAFVFIIVYSLAAARFQFSDKLYFFLLILGSILFGAYMGEAIYIVILIIFGGAIFKAISRFVT